MTQRHGDLGRTGAGEPAPVVLDHRGFVLQWSAEAESLLGYSGREAVGRPMADMLVAESEDPATYLRRRDSTVVRCELGVSPHTAQDGTFTWHLRLGDRAVVDAAAGDRAQRDLRLIAAISARVGTTLDVMHTARELAHATVPRMATGVTVDLLEAVLRGEEPPHDGALAHEVLRRAAASCSEFGPSGRASVPMDFSVTDGESLADLRPRLFRPPQSGSQPSPFDETRRRLLAEAGVHSTLSIPLRARGGLLGVANFYRSGEHPVPFAEDDLPLAQEVASRAALCLDNAYRYTREHHAVQALRRDLEPEGLPEQSAAEVVHGFDAPHGTSCWYDVIPLSGARVALVVGDVPADRMHAAAVIGRLRTAVRTLAALDTAPDELMARLDELVAPPAAGARPRAGPSIRGPQTTIGATCLYVVHDPVRGMITAVSAGRSGGSLVARAGTVEPLGVPDGPVLGARGAPRSAVRSAAPEGTLLCLQAPEPAAPEGGRRATGASLDALTRVLRGAGGRLQDTYRSIAQVLAPSGPRSAAPVLLARTRAIPDDRLASWELPVDPAIVGTVRALAEAQLRTWQIAEDVRFSTELVVSELVTNAVRHASEPIVLRLIRDQALLCEVSDGSTTAPHLRQAGEADEGGRGLFLVGELASHWGTRYEGGGKTIWTEQSLADT